MTLTVNGRRYFGADRPVQHPYSPSTCPSIDGAGCLHRPRNADGTYSLVPCKRPQKEHTK